MMLLKTLKKVSKISIWILIWFTLPMENGALTFIIKCHHLNHLSKSGLTSIIKLLRPLFKICKKYNVEVAPNYSPKWWKVVLELNGKRKKKIFPPFLAENLFKLLRCPPTQLQLHVVCKSLKSKCSRRLIFINPSFNWSLGIWCRFMIFWGVNPSPLVVLGSVFISESQKCNTCKTKPWKCVGWCCSYHYYLWEDEEAWRAREP